MIAHELINHMIPPLKLTDDAHKAMVWMEELRSNQLPVVDKGKFLGLISEEIILDENDVEKLVSELELFGTECIVDEGDHFYDVIKMASDFNVDIVGVINNQGKYVGVITIQDTISSFAQTAAVQLPGGIIVLSLDQIDYSLSEISRLIEGENAKILSSIVKEDVHDASKIRLTLKIDKVDLSHITATLERFEYRIIARFQESKIIDNEKEKVDMLLKYLNI
jgi:CBS domain-containing protein